jgi:hypothetical protein
VAIVGLLCGASVSALRAACITMTPMCTDACRVDEQFCIKEGTSWEGWEYDMPVVLVDPPFACCINPEYGSADTKKSVKVQIYADCTPVCPSDTFTTGTPKGDTVGDPFDTENKTKCSGKPKS